MREARRAHGGEPSIRSVYGVRIRCVVARVHGAAHAAQTRRIGQAAVSAHSIATAAAHTIVQES